MNVEIQIYDQDDKELSISAILYSYGVIKRYSQTADEPSDIEVLKDPIFRDILITDEDSKEWEPTGDQLESVEEQLYDWWYMCALQDNFT